MLYFLYNLVWFIGLNLLKCEEMVTVKMKTKTRLAWFQIYTNQNRQVYYTSHVPILVFKNKAKQDFKRSNIFENLIFPWFESDSYNQALPIW